MAGATTILLQAAVQLVSAGLYLWVARLVLKRDPQGQARRANTLFAVWWVALGVVYVMIPAYTIPARVFGHHDLALVVTLLDVLLVLIAVAFWGLLYYLVYLYTGNPRWFWPITAFYGALGIALLYAVAWLEPNGFDANGNVTYAREQLGSSASLTIGLMFSVPILLAALAYGSLFFKVREPLARYRIALVSGAFLIQFGWSATSTTLRLNQRYPGSVTLSLIGNGLAVLAALAIVLAFRPPEAVRLRLGTSPEAR